MLAAAELDHDQPEPVDHLVDITPFDAASLETIHRPARNLRVANGGWQPQTPAESVILGLSVSVVLQMLMLDRKSCVIKIEVAGKSGQLTLIDGDLVDATAGSMGGEIAVYELLSWTGVRQIIQALSGPAARTVFLPLSQMLIESARRSDEYDAGMDAAAEVAAKAPKAPRRSKAEAGPTVSSPTHDALQAAVLARVTALPGVHAALVSSWEDLAGLLPAAVSNDVALAATIDAARAMASLVQKSGVDHDAFEESVCTMGAIRILMRPVTSLTGIVAIVVADSAVFLSVLRQAILA